MNPQIWNFEAMKKFETQNPFEVVENNSEESINDSMRKLDEIKQMSSQQPQFPLSNVIPEDGDKANTDYEESKYKQMSHLPSQEKVFTKTYELVDKIYIFFIIQQ